MQIHRDRFSIYQPIKHKLQGLLLAQCLRKKPWQYVRIMLMSPFCEQQGRYHHILKVTEFFLYNRYKGEISKLLTLRGPLEGKMVWKTVWQFLKKLNIELLCEPLILFFGTY